MITVTLREPTILGWKYQVLSFIRSVPAAVLSLFGVRTTQPDDAAFEKAVKTLQLAAEPDENYATLSTRLEREAAIYRNFLQRYQQISKISLRVKELNSHDADFASSKQQIQVLDPSEGKRDPGEGRVSVCYTFNRSASRVLEFVVHDETGASLFAIARTYSNWLGSKEFNLGFNRTFYLDMLEEEPGYVMVYAGFKPALKRDYDTAIPRLRELMRPVPSYGLDSAEPEPEPEPQKTGWWPAAHAKPEYATAIRCAVISVFCSSLFWVATMLLPAKKPSVTEPIAVAAPEIRATAADYTAGTTPNINPESLGATVTIDARLNKQIRTRSPQQAKRLAGVKGFSISVDNNSCKTMDDQCFELLSDVQKGVHLSLSNLSAPFLKETPPQTGPEPAKLVVSYNAIDLMHGQVHLTLYDREGALWNDNSNLTYANLTEPTAVNAYCEAASSEIVLEILKAKAQLNSDADSKQASPTSKSE